jgi:hypothetical protein
VCEPRLESPLFRVSFAGLASFARSLEGSLGLDRTLHLDGMIDPVQLDKRRRGPRRS